MIAERVRALRIRSGLSKRQVAIGAGWKGASSYQYYEDPDDFTKPVLPLDICLRLIPVLVGRGEPPITRAEVMELAGIEQSSGHAALELALSELNAAVNERRLQDALGHAHIVLGQLTLLSR